MKKILMKLSLVGVFFLGSILYSQQQNLQGKVTNQKDKPIHHARITIQETGQSQLTDKEGVYNFENLPNGNYTLIIEYPNGETGIETVSVVNGDVSLDFKESGTYTLGEVEIFGERNKKQRGIESITRFPVNTNDQIQTVSIVSEKLIEDQGALTITDAAKNVPGVILFSSYGGSRESMSIRGFRGTPVLKNGVRMDSDFRTSSATSDMAGVESIQVIKGSAAITQGIGDDLGSAGGVINVVTKTPRFRNEAEIGVRSGSWLRSRMDYDAQTVLGKSNNIGVRIDGAFQSGNSYWDEVKNKRIYVNPSVAWRPDTKTEIILEMDYLNDHSTPNKGTINIGPDTEENLYEMGHKFTGFKSDVMKVENITYSGRVNREITKNIDARVGFFNSYYDSDSEAASLANFKDEDGNIIYNKKVRGIGRSYRNDRNSTLQVDLMGKDFKFGVVKWAWQVGYDYTMNRVDTRSAKGINNIDVIDVFQQIDNADVKNFANYDASKLALGEAAITHNYYYGFMTQHHISITEYFKLIGGVRWSYSIQNHESVVDPVIGLMISPYKNINLFASYTTTSSLRSANNPLEGGGTVGVSRTKQYEFGVKSQWFNDRLRANITYYDMNNENLSYQTYDENQTATGLYGLAGNLKRKGVEIEVAGRPYKNLQMMLGYAYLDAFYEDSPAYMDGSRPMNAPKNTANAWLHYKFDQNSLKGLSIGAGVYFIGERPVNEYTKITAVHNTVPGVKYFDMPSYTTLSAQLGYEWNKLNFKLFFNNITNAIGYSSYYRGGFINQIDPFNISAQINYKF